MQTKLFASGWLLLLIFTDSGLVKHGGDYDNKKECAEAWAEVRQCYVKILEKEKAKKKDDCFLYCGQPIGFCIEGERMTAPGLLFPLPKGDHDPCE